MVRFIEDMDKQVRMKTETIRDMQEQLDNMRQQNDDLESTIMDQKRKNDELQRRNDSLQLQIPKRPNARSRSPARSPSVASGLAGRRCSPAAASR
jgi:FtsZ-binding cell division protein ZapB